MNDKKIKLGFSTGCLYKDLEVKEAISVIKNLGCKYVELGFITSERFFSEQLDRVNEKDLEGFEYISFHTPTLNYAINYGNNDETKKFFERMTDFSKRVNLDLVVFHPDTVEDFSIFENADFKIGFENMDNRKKSCKSVDDIENILLKNSNFKFILDVNHCYSNDSSMKLDTEFHERLGNRISQIHLSGFNGYHDPLFETKQLEIIRSIQNFDVPIIVESVVNPETIAQEKDYILQNI
jgi:sugar phosphate isomerase/epimerase